MPLLKTQEIEDVLVVHFANAKILDEAVIQQIGEELMECAKSARQKKKLLLSFNGVKLMSSAMIGKLVLLNKKCKHDGVVLKMCDISPDIREVFRRTL